MTETVERDFDHHPDGLHRAHAYFLAGFQRVLREKTRLVEDRTLTAFGHRYLPDYFDLPPSDMHRVLGARYHRAMRERRAKIVARGPRGSAKTVYGGLLYPLDGALTGLEKYTLVIGDTMAQAVKYLAPIKRELEANARLARRWPDACGVGPVWNSTQIVTRNGCCVEALGVDSKIRGRRFGRHRPTAVVVDDPEGDEAAYSPTLRARVWEWFTKGALNCGAPDTNFIVQGTMVHRDCLVARLGQTAGWELLRWRAIRSWPTRMDLWGAWQDLYCDPSRAPEVRERQAREYYAAHAREMDLGARVLWPERETLYDLMKKLATQGRAAFGSECQDEPYDPEKCEWSPECFEGEDLWFDEWPKDLVVRAMALDPSKGRADREGDFQALVEMGVGADGLLYVDADLGRRPIDAMIERLIDRALAFEPDGLVCEAEQFQELILPMVEQACRKRQVLVPIEGIAQAGVRKPVRIRRLSPYVSRRRLRWKRRSPGAAECKRQLQDFPHGEHDDGPDALEMCLRLAADLLADEEAKGVYGSARAMEAARRF